MGPSPTLGQAKLQPQRTIAVLAGWRRNPTKPRPDYKKPSFAQHSGTHFEAQSRSVVLWE